MGERRILQLVPRAGRGLFTAWSRFSFADFFDSYSAWRDTLIQDNSWRNAIGTLGSVLPTGGGLGSGPVWAIYIFNSIDTTSSTAQPVSVGLAHVGGTVNPVGGTATLGRYDTNSAVLSTTAPHELCFLTIKNRVFIAGATLTAGAKPTIVTKYPTATFYNWGIAEPVASLSYTAYTTSGLAAADYPALRLYYNPGGTGTGITTTINTTPIASAGAGSFDATGKWDGKTLLVNNGTETYRINTITSATAGSITTNATVSRGPDAAYEVHYGRLTWGEEPPQYAYAYYNPTTGHSSSRSPVLLLSEKNMSDVGVEITGIPLTNDPNYTHVILFRNDVTGGGDVLW
ncbi:MAG: hypothetical protein ACREEM_41340, partial [Blastocatellia bacterium]